MKYYINIDEITPFVNLNRFYTIEQLQNFNLIYKYLLIINPQEDDILLSYDKTFYCSNKECKIIEIINLLETQNFELLFKVFNITKIINFAIENNNLDILEYYITTFNFTYYNNDLKNIFKKYFNIEDELQKIFYSKYIEYLTQEKICNIVFYWILTTPEFDYMQLINNKKIFNAVLNHKQIFNIVLYNLNKRTNLTNYIMLKIKKKNFTLRRSTLLWCIPSMFFFISHVMHRI
jgi:hypothetical protein